MARRTPLGPSGELDEPGVLGEPRDAEEPAHLVQRGDRIAEPLW